jgi:hypothetical protein
MTLPELSCPRPRTRHSPLSGPPGVRGPWRCVPVRNFTPPARPAPTAGPPHEVFVDPSIPAEAAGDAQGALARPHTEHPFGRGSDDMSTDRDLPPDRRISRGGW